MHVEYVLTLLDVLGIESMAVRIIDIAKDVKLPISTVGNILRNDSRYGDELTEKVRNSALKLGYRPNILARGLKGGKTQTIGIVWSLKGFHTPVDLVQNIAFQVQQRGYVSHISDSFCDADAINQILLDYAQRGVDAVVVQMVPGMPIHICLRHLSYFRAMVFVPSFPLPEAVDQVVVNRDRAIHDLVDQFIKTGRKRPYIMVPLNPRIEKIAPFLDRLNYHGIPAGDDFVIPYQSHKVKELPDICWNLLESRFADQIPFDALFCGVDEVAIVAYKWLMARGRKIPQDVAIVGFNDSIFSKYLSPSLASIDRCDDEVAEVIEKILFNRLENPNLAPQQVTIPMKFVWRESAG
jgi:DNA-binding LacI/PurR family transcriptional regulator